MPSYPHIGFFPSLKLKTKLELGDWVVGSEFQEVRWASKEFETLSNSLIESFKARKFVECPRLWHRERGFDGRKPDPDDYRAIHAAVAFAVLNANDLVPPGDRERQLATAENVELFLQPIDGSGRLTGVRPGWLRGESIAGWPIGKDPPPLADAVFPLQLPVPASSKLAAAAYTFLRGQSPDRSNVELAMEWHRVAMSNPDPITLQQRVVAIKVGFEAIFRTDKSHLCAKALKALFESTTAGDLDLFPTREILWSPTERMNLARSYQQKGKSTPTPCVRSELEDWFMRLADARNEIIHKGSLTITDFPAPKERPRSRYKGPLFCTGERLLREAIRAKLGADMLLCRSYTEREIWKAAVADGEAAARAAGVTDEPAPAAPVVAAPSVPARDLPTLLGLLECQTANQVAVAENYDASSPPEMVARATALDEIHSWAEFSGEGFIEITAEECALLKREGAEDLLPTLVHLCD